MSEIQELRQIVKKFVSERDWNKFHSPKNLSMSISIEAAEIMELFQWYTNDESNSPNFIEEHRNQIEDEIADVFIYLLSFVNVCNIDLKNAVVSKMKRNETRFPIEKVKGKLI
jgi:NTP pyrophosphatase (non-canonical NTP hydrolase)